ncbi:hypothetical protein [Cupriavidus metallidurans]|uniref:hypothetical protein n=1 Tax=Cupriavidus metallidurans TaxID=119219 RepID=UPI000A817ADB|nr:hypothetical protein [Cupriavidus metallidurans]
MDKPVPGAASRKPAGKRQAGPPGQPHAGFPSPDVMAFRQLQRVEGAMGVVTVAVEHAAAPEFSNEGAALILRMLRQEAARALEELSPY